MSSYYFTDAIHFSLVESLHVIDQTICTCHPFLDPVQLQEQQTLLYLNAHPPVVQWIPLSQPMDCEEWWEPGHISRFWEKSPGLKQSSGRAPSDTKKSTKMKEHSACSFKSCPTRTLISFCMLKKNLLPFPTFLAPKITSPGKKVSVRGGRRCHYQLGCESPPV